MDTLAMDELRDFSLSRLAELSARFPELRVAVVGDFFLDKYLDVDPSLAETSVETGKIAHQVVAVRHSPGAAGTIVSNLAALDAGELYAIGFTGDDGEGYDLRSGLQKIGCSTEYLYADRRLMTPTYLKPRDINQTGLAGEHSRYDTKNRKPTAAELEEKIIHALEMLVPRVDAVIAQDQVEEDGCGVLTSKVVETLSDLAERYPENVFWADSRYRIRRFRGQIVKPNQYEVLGLVRHTPEMPVEMSVLYAAVISLRNEVQSPVCCTLGAGGMLVSDPHPTLVPGVKLSGPTDPTGAGDSATAGAVLALAACATLPEAALIGNLVASLTVEQLGTTGTARREQLPDRLQLWLSQRHDTVRVRKEG